jgi:SAM-dependent methyltransferase
MATPKADYGIDAPTRVRNRIIGGMIGIAAGFILYLTVVPIRPVAGGILSIVGFMSGLCLLARAGLMVWWSKSGKIREREHLIDALGLVGNEKVLDVGCGRGLLLNGVARRLPKGKAFGIDLWRDVDQSGNSPEAVLANSKAENVADRVEIKTADMRDLPFPDEIMDAVISGLAIHNIPDRDGRAKAIREIARVLKPKGRVALQDLRSTGEYIETLTDLGWKDVTSSGLTFMGYLPIRIVTGRKP